MLKLYGKLPLSVRRTLRTFYATVAGAAVVAAIAALTDLSTQVKSPYVVIVLGAVAALLNALGRKSDPK